MSPYTLFNILGIAALALFNLSRFSAKQKILGERSIAWMMRSREKGESLLVSKESFWIVMEILAVTTIQYGVAPPLNSMFGKIIDTGLNYFGFLYFGPVFVLLACWIWKIDFLKQLDLITPALPLALSFAKLGCYTARCCGGIEYELAIYTSLTGRAEFPIQLLESCIALVLFVVLIWREGTLVTGTVYPIYLIMYSGLRFFTEFLRREPVVLYGLRTYQILCLIGVALGIIEYLLAKRIGKRAGKDLTELEALGKEV